jgi:hypothetical protein
MITVWAVVEAWSREQRWLFLFRLSDHLHQFVLWLLIQAERMTLFCWVPRVPVRSYFETKR